MNIEDVHARYPYHPLTRIIEAHNRFQVMKPGITFLEFYERMHLTS